MNSNLAEKLVPEFEVIKKPRKSLEERINIPHEVDPLKNIKDIMKVKSYFRGKHDRYGQPDLRDYCLFVVGINIGLRAGDLLRLKIDDVWDIDNLKVKTTVNTIEEKTRKPRTFELNDSAQDAIRIYALSRKNSFKPGEYLFQSRKGDNVPITVASVHKLLKATLREFNIKGNYGSHTLRKTFAYHIYNKEVGTNPGIIQTLQRMLNHSSQSETLKYIGITKEVIKDVYKGLNL